MDCSLPGSSVHGDSRGKNTGVDFHALLQGNLLNLGIKPRSPILQADSLPSEPPGKPKNTGVSSLSLLQGIFLPMNWTRASCIAGGFLTSWATREGHPFILFFIVLVMSSDFQHLSFHTRDQTWDPAVKTPGLNHWTTRKFPTHSFI